MISFPNSKLNLGLNVIRKREDGYHDIETVFYPIGLSDILEVIPDNHSTSSKTVRKKAGIKFFPTGLPINGAEQKNLCIRAYDLLRQDFESLPPVQVYLHKAIPVGAGLGGGSADGSFCLRLLNQKFHLKLSTEQLLDYALRLGSDCPFFILNRPCFATGRGEFLHAIDLDLSGYSFVIVNPGIHISTAWAFQQLQPGAPSRSIKNIIELPVTQWKDSLRNDFEEPVFKHHPTLAGIKSLLYEAGAIYASLSGTGSCFYSIFPKHATPDLQLPDSISVIRVP